MNASASRQPAVRFIFVTLVLIVLGFGIIIPVLPGLVKEFEGGSVERGSQWYGWLVSIFALMQFIAAPVLGALSDQFGRRRVLMITLAGSAIDYVVMGFAPSIRWLFVARIISGLTAGSMSTANAYIADVTPPEKRAQGYGMLGAAFGLGLVIGPVFGGFLGHLGNRVPFFAAAGCVALNWLYGFFVLPESLLPENRRKFNWGRANPVGALRSLTLHRGVVDLAGVYQLFMLSSVMLQATWVLYMQNRYGWSSGQVGLSMALAGLTSALVQGRLVRPIIGRIGEQHALIWGLLYSAIIMVAYGLATQGWMIYVIIFFGAFAGIVGPATQALVTKHVPPTEYGSVQGSLGILQSVAGFVAPPIAAWSFGYCFPDTSRLHLPGVAFFEAAVLYLLAVAFAVRAFRLDARAEALAGAGKAGAVGAEAAPARQP